MAGLGAFAQKKMLDFVCGGASATPPSAWWVGLSWGTPNFTGGSEIASSFGYTRQTATFGAAASPVGSASNIAAMTWLSFASACSILRSSGLGWQRHRRIDAAVRNDANAAHVRCCRQLVYSGWWHHHHTGMKEAGGKVA